MAESIVADGDGIGPSDIAGDGGSLGIRDSLVRGSALNLNVHLHMLVLDGAYTFEHDKPHFHRAPAPSPTELRQLLDTLIARITRTLVRGGELIEEPEHPYLDLELNSPLEQLSAAAVRYPFAVGPLVGRKTMTLLNPGARLHGRDCSRQSPAFPPLHMDVQVPQRTWIVRERPSMAVRCRR